MNLVRLSDLFRQPPPILEAQEDPGAELRRRIEALAKSWDYGKAKELGDWMNATFSFGASRTPRGQKETKKDAEFLHRFLIHQRVPVEGDTEERRQARVAELKQRWGYLEDKVDALVQHFSRAGKGKSVPAEMKAGGNTYINQVGFSERILKKWVAHFEKLWGSLKGWRRKALAGGLTVVLSRPSEFGQGSTAAGVYRAAKDQMMVRATPKILKRSGGSYGAPDYVLVHELAHRYERKARQPNDFDKRHWWTTKYSRKEGESFAELFAMGHFKPTNASMAVDKETAAERIAKFERIMGGGKTEGRAVRLSDVVREVVFGEDVGHLHLVSKKKKLAKAKVKGQPDDELPMPEGVGSKNPGAGVKGRLNRRAKSIPI